MAQYSENHKRTVYTIPVNFYEAGNFVFLGLTFNKRRTVEAACLVFLTQMLLSIFPIPGGWAGAFIRVFLSIPQGVAGLFGIRGDPVSTWAMQFLKWKKRNKLPILYNAEPEPYIEEAVRLAMDEPVLRSREDSRERAKDEENAQRISQLLAEGNFVFADDPQREAMRKASMNYLEKLSQQTASETPPPEPPAPAVDFPLPALDLSEIIAGELRLEDVDLIYAEGDAAPDTAPKEKNGSQVGANFREDT